MEPLHNLPHSLSLFCLTLTELFLCPASLPSHDRSLYKSPPLRCLNTEPYLQKPHLNPRHSLTRVLCTHTTTRYIFACPCCFCLSVSPTRTWAPWAQDFAYSFCVVSAHSRAWSMAGAQLLVSGWRLCRAPTYGAPTTCLTRCQGTFPTSLWIYFGSEKQWLYLSYRWKNGGLWGAGTCPRLQK